MNFIKVWVKLWRRSLWGHTWYYLLKIFSRFMYVSGLRINHLNCKRELSIFKACSGKIGFYRFPSWKKRTKLFNRYLLTGFPLIVILTIFVVNITRFSWFCLYRTLIAWIFIKSLWRYYLSFLFARGFKQCSSLKIPLSRGFRTFELSLFNTLRA